VEDSIKLQNQLLPLEKFRKRVKYSSEPIEQSVPPRSSSGAELTTYGLLQDFGGSGGRHTKRRKSKKAKRTRRKF